MNGSDYQLRNIERMCEFLTHRVYGLEWQLTQIRDKVAPLPNPRSEAWKKMSAGDEVMHRRWIADLYAARLPLIGRK